MKKTSTKDRSLLILGLINFFIVQWFFLRLAFKINPPIKDYVTKRRPLLLLKWVFPLSGWFGIPLLPRKYKAILLLCGVDVCVAPYTRNSDNY